MDRVLLGGYAVSESEAIVHLIAAQVIAAAIIFIVGMRMVIHDRRHREANEEQSEAKGCGEKGEKDDAKNPNFAGEVPGTQQRTSWSEVDGV